MRKLIDDVLDTWATWLWMAFKLFWLSLGTGLLCGILYAAGRFIWNKVLP